MRHQFNVGMFIGLFWVGGTVPPSRKIRVGDSHPTPRKSPPFWGGPLWKYFSPNPKKSPPFWGGAASIFLYALPPKIMKSPPHSGGDSTCGWDLSPKPGFFRDFGAVFTVFLEEFVIRFRWNDGKGRKIPNVCLDERRYGLESKTPLALWFDGHGGHRTIACRFSENSRNWAFHSFSAVGEKLYIFKC